MKTDSFQINRAAMAERSKASCVLGWQRPRFQGTSHVDVG